MRISDWSSDVCSSDLPAQLGNVGIGGHEADTGNRCADHLDDPAVRPDALQAVRFHAAGQAHAQDDHLLDVAGTVFAMLDIPAHELGKRRDRKGTRLNSSHYCATRIPSSSCKTK